MRFDRSADWFIDMPINLRWSLYNDIADEYERVMVPHFFEPVALHLVSLLPLRCGQRLLDVAAKLPPEELTRDFQTSDKCVLDTLVHIYVADRIWLSLVLAEPRPLRDRV